MEIKDMTTDHLLELIAWARDRAAYRRACQQPIDGADTTTVYAAMDELGRRDNWKNVMKL